MQFKTIFTMREHARSMFQHFLAVFVVICLMTGCEKDVVNPEFGSETIQTEKSGKIMEPGEPELLVSGLQGTSGSTIGPGGALFVTEGATGQVTRIDPSTGSSSTYATGLPQSVIGIGGAVDLVFYDDVAYVLVALVGPQFGTNDTVGIYRIDGPDSHTVIADIGAFNLNHEDFPFNTFVEMGVPYAIQKYKGGFLVTDGHFNRVLHVTKDGMISVIKSFDNIVPTGLEVSGNTIYMAEAGPVPHLPENGKVVSFGPNSDEVNTVATGARLLVDVEFNRGRTLFALSQGIFQEGNDEGSPANPNTGSLVKVNDDGSFTTIAEELNLPTSFEFIKNKAYIVNLAGEVWTVDHVASAPFGK